MPEGETSARRSARYLTVALLAVVALDLLGLLVARQVLLGEPSGLGIVLRGGILVALFAAAFPARNRPGSALFAILFLIALVQFRFAEGRRMGDGFFYYAYLQSFWKDGDVDFRNEYAQYGIADEPSVAVPTETGLLRNNFSVGPAVLWSPFFGIGEIHARLAARGDPSVDRTGYGPIHQRAVQLGTLLYGFAAVLLVHGLLRRYFSAGAALAGALLMWLATPLHWYLIYQPFMSHGLSTFAAALFIWHWDRSRTKKGLSAPLLLGMIGGLAVLVRWQNALLLALPALDLLRKMKHSGFRPDADVLGRVSAIGVGTLAAVLPQLLAWKAIFGAFLLASPPQGPEYLRLARPFVLETLFSSRHGLLSWTPVAWLGFLGFVPLLRKRDPARFVFVSLFAVLAAMTYVNFSVGDWWGGGSFGSRRFDAALPIFAVGIAASFLWLRGLVERRPTLIASAALAALVLWNLLLMEQYRRYLIPPDDTVYFPDVAAGSATLVTESVGSPWSWPANWWFAWRHGLPPGKYDRLVGRYLFYRNNSLGGRIDLGEDDGGLLGEGWRRPEQREGVWARQIRQESARLLVPLESPLALSMDLRVSSRPGALPVRVSVNGREVGRFVAEPGFSSHSIRTASEHWRRGINELSLVLEKPSADFFLLVDRVDFRRER